MKTLTTLTVGALVACLCASYAVAQGSGADSPRKAVIRPPSLDLLAVGVSTEWETRTLESSPGAGMDLETRSTFARLYLDILPFATVNAGGGLSQVNEDIGGYGDAEFMWTAGGTVSIFEHDVSEPPFAACRLRLQAFASYWEKESGGGDSVMAYEWEETRAGATVSAEFFSEPFGAKVNAFPYSAVFSFGPVFSDVDMDVISPSGRVTQTLSEKEDVGLLVGIDVKLARNVSVAWEGRIYEGNEDDSHLLTAILHF